MKDTYNGWANYETWRVNLEVLDGMTAEDFDFTINEDVSDSENAENLGESLESYVCELVEDGVPSGLALDLARSFLAKVDWTEIAEHLIEDMA